MFRQEQLLKAVQGRLYGAYGKGINGPLCIDSRLLRRGDIFIAIKGNNFDGHDFIAEALKRGAAAVVVHKRGVIGRNKNKIPFILVKDTLKALGDLARFQRRRLNIPVIVITGSNGKTTTKEMLACLLGGRAKVLKSEGTKNNQIGLPLTLAGLDDSYDFAVLEAGTNHPGEIACLGGIALPNIAVITNIGAAHLKYFKDLEGVYREKISLLREMSKPRIGLFNADCRLLGRAAIDGDKQRLMLGFGIERRADFSASEIKIRGGRINFLLNKKYSFTLRSPGYYNVYNALAAVAVARLFGIDYGEMARRLSSFEFPAGRLKELKLNNLSFIDDTYNSNPVSLGQALDSLARFPAKGRKIFVMGDMLELGPDEQNFHLRAGRKAASICDYFLAVGRLSRLAAESAKLGGLDKERVFVCDDSLQARAILFKKISPRPEDIILVKGSRSMKMEQVFR